MKDMFRWQIPVPRALYIKLKMISIEEGKTVCDFTKTEIDSFVNSLVLKVSNTEETRKKQEADATSSTNLTIEENNSIEHSERVF